MQNKPLILALLAGLALSGAAQATLMDRGGGLIYDNVLNLTWLQDANYAQTSGYDADGRMNWTDANAWAAGLSYGVYSDWRLPTVSPIGASFNYGFSNNGTTDYGYGNTSPNSEMAYMYYVNLANLGYCTPNGGGSSFSFIEQTGWGLANTGLFDNLQPYVYWSGTSFPPNPSSAWYFDMHLGSQYALYKHYELYAWAVRPGDVAAVPEPATLLLLGLGLAGLGAMRRRG